MITVLYTITLLVASYLLFYSAYWLMLIVAGLLTTSGPKKKSITPGATPELLLILPAYRPGPIFHKVLEATYAAIQNKSISVYVLLQNADEKYAKAASQFGFHVEEKSFDTIEGNSYQHALKYICTKISEGQIQGNWSPEFVMLIDKDNILSADFFDQIPANAYEKYDIIQGRRAALPTTSSVGLFDTYSELLNDVMFRSAKERLKLVVELSGSGALIESDLFIQSIKQLDPLAPGFDKNFMVQLLANRREVRTTFQPSCILWEEKTADETSLNPQRIRWFGEQYYNAIFHSRTLLKAAIRYNRISSLEYWITLCRPPRSVHMTLAALAAGGELIAFILGGHWPLYFPIFTMSATLVGLSLSLFVVHQNTPGSALRLFTKIPSIAFHNFFNALQSLRKENRGKFIHTTHKL